MLFSMKRICRDNSTATWPILKTR